MDTPTPAGPTEPTETTGPTAQTAGFDALLDSACDVAQRAYAPYSGFRVGAAGLADDGRTVTGCNVENAGYGVTLCAECGLVSELIAGGGGKLEKFVCVNGDGAVIMPCGRCRQLLAEHASPQFRILTPLGERTLDAVLPQAFGPADLDDPAAADPAGPAAAERRTEGDPS
ncbi:cytidine deaminase [Helcobacillus massiliensis]|uniref:Cytidine deaminase n=1 Tax=Helcobacillus massiliensis TaxID=521392 RepID=A0A839QQ85_9MICO|nr:cytidine deaminase [Helcobacillus massiliensis]MBB3021935.1 cytidine deaminase [Helcobacillus massiliensis]